MGILRLSQDLIPYSETAVLGSERTNDLVLVERLVIDGPSLIYHVYSKLHSYKVSNKSDTFAAIPTYSEINDATLRLLSDLEEHGVQIVKIYFDGALPVSKRPTRLERLERTRQQLQIYRKSHPNLQVSDIKTDEPTDLSDGVWSSAHISTRTAALPAPPFMVAGAIEALTQSKWGSCVEIVPDEADAYCAACACLSHAAILSNDSDLVLYDSNHETCVVQTHSLVLMSVLNDSRHKVIQAQCLRPNHISQRLGIKRLLDFGFWRSAEASASTHIIADRTRQEVYSVTEQMKRSNFAKGYRNVDLEDKTHSSLDGLDPRTAEIVSSLNDPTQSSLQIYLPTLIEDPDRDSSWSYGLEYRQIAYSLLANHASQSSRTSEHITEFSRKGTRITPTEIPILSTSTISSRLAQLVHQCTIYAPSSIRQSHILALHSITTKKHSAGKRVDSILSSTLDWSAIHLVANVHAALYSLRMLAQVLRNVGSAEARHVSSSTWSVAETFLAPLELRRVINADRELWESEVQRMLFRVDPVLVRGEKGDGTGLVVKRSKKRGRRVGAMDGLVAPHGQKVARRDQSTTNPFELLGDLE